MQKPQRFSASRTCSGMQLRAATALGSNHSHALAARDCNSFVIASAIDNDDFHAASQTSNGVERISDRASFVESRDDDLDFCKFVFLRQMHRSLLKNLS